jgi:transcriptional regulator with PAS, ATPase and Fis domain
MSTDLRESAKVEAMELPSEAVLFGSTAGMRKVRVAIEGALHNSTPVLIQGESGTGKELVGRFLHFHSSLSKGPFIKVNCAAMSKSLLEGELFGYETGAFPGAREHRRGAIESSEGGTVFLDEISELDWELQAKLLGVLSSGHFVRIGGDEELSSRVRVICATSSNLEGAVARQAFRPDLLSSLDIIRIRLLPLRERTEDIPQLCEYLLEKLARNFRKSAPKLSEPALQILQQWKWPGNLRELENWIARIIIFGTEEVLGLDFSRQLTGMGNVGHRQHRAVHLRWGATKRTRRPRGS